MGSLGEMTFNVAFLMLAVKAFQRAFDHRSQ